MKILKWIGAGIGLFTVLVIVFVVMFMLEADESAALPVATSEDGEVIIIPPTELELMTAMRDSIQAHTDSLMLVLAQRSAEIDSLGGVLAFRDAAVNALEARLQDKDAAITELRELDVNAQEMARTFSTMNIDQLSPIMAQLTDGVVLDIYKHTSNKRRRFLLAAMGDNRAAKLTNGLVRK